MIKHCPVKDYTFCISTVSFKALVGLMLHWNVVEFCGGYFWQSRASQWDSRPTVLGGKAHFLLARRIPPCSTGYLKGIHIEDEIRS